LSCSTKKNYFPEKISNLLLVKTISGKEAYDLINKLHFQPVAQGSSEIGFYENLSGSAVIYITHYKSKKDAKVYFDKMTEKISPENSVFINQEFFDYEGNNIYKCFGMGKTHFVFTYNTELFWIAVDTHIATEFFRKYYSSIQ